MYYLTQACGAKHHILEEEVDETDVDDVVVALVNKAKRVSFTFIMSSFCGTLSFFYFVHIYFLFFLLSAANMHHKFLVKDNN